ncbi:S8 family serine peptidase [Massilia terrae]|uniref:S8 family serine peptidase n=1 Tax=Massilia terrae TaxID=1811224 RepID=A0ABT2D2L4_9BURK|nr:S8 family serine peptidase [Massilia terrae]
MRLPAIAIALCAALCAAAPPACAAQQDAATREDAASHRVLVMLRMPAPHFRPDSAYAGGYAEDGARAALRRTARELAATYKLTLVDDWPMPAIGIDCFVMEASADAPLEPVLALLARDPRVAWAQPLNQYHGLEADPLLQVQPAERFWHLSALQRASTGRKVAVAVIDSGIDADHPDLAGQLDRREDFVDDKPDTAEAHGTAVAGIIAAHAGNGKGIAGIAPDARLMGLRACWETRGQPARCNTFTLGKAIHFALVNDARIINLSLSGPPDRLLQTLLDAAAARGVAVVGAFDPQRADGGFPASYPGVIAVATDDDPRLLPAYALRAPGTDIPTSLPGGRWGMVSGASFAAAHVSGLTALLLALQPGTTPARLRRELASPPTARVSASGNSRAGRIDACAAVGRAAGACVCQCPTTTAATFELLP